MYIETSSPVAKDYSALLRSGVIPFSSSSRCLSFYYHMYGTGVGALNVYVATATQSTLVWSLKGDQGNSWRDATVSIAAGLGNIRVIVFK